MRKVVHGEGRSCPELFALEGQEVHPGDTRGAECADDRDTVADTDLARRQNEFSSKLEGGKRQARTHVVEHRDTGLQDATGQAGPERVVAAEDGRRVRRVRGANVSEQDLLRPRLD